VSQQFYYLISSLPVIALGADPALRSDAFLERCQARLDPERYARLAAVTLDPEAVPYARGAAQRWRAWETWLRNQIAAARAPGHEQDANRWTRPEPDVFPSDRRRLEEILAMPSPLRRERALDELRWRRIDDLAAGHEFDFDALVIYRLHLLLAEKWAGRSAERGAANLDELVQGGIEQARAVRVTQSE